MSCTGLVDPRMYLYQTQFHHPSAQCFVTGFLITSAFTHIVAFSKAGVESWNACVRKRKDRGKAGEDDSKTRNGGKCRKPFTSEMFYRCLSSKYAFAEERSTGSMRVFLVISENEFGPIFAVEMIEFVGTRLVPSK